MVWHLQARAAIIASQAETSTLCTYSLIILFFSYGVKQVCIELRPTLYIPAIATSGTRARTSAGTGSGSLRSRSAGAFVLSIFLRQFVSGHRWPDPDELARCARSFIAGSSRRSMPQHAVPSLDYLRRAEGGVIALLRPCCAH